MPIETAQVVSFAETRVDLELSDRDATRSVDISELEVLYGPAIRHQQPIDLSPRGSFAFLDEYRDPSGFGPEMR